jgi:hypothetical protein
MRPARLAAPAATRLAALAFALVAGCATAGQERAGVCPEYRSLRCATVLRCAADAKRGCLVCACAPWDASAKDTGASSAYPDGDPRNPALPPVR